MAGVTDPVVDNAADVQLVERIRADPSAGWAEAWDRYGHRLHSFCLRMLDDPAEAEDAVADVFLVAAQRIDHLRQPEAFRAWLYAIARRRIQRRWKDRTRTTPVDPHGETVVNNATEELDPAASGDAAELLAAASAGLTDKDRELLALTLGADLDTTEVARITGESVNAVSVKVTRLKETVGRAAGALLVARHHRRDCEVLDGILEQWEGTFDTLWRKRIARHIEACDDCSERSKAATAVFAAPLLLAPPAASLRDRVLGPLARSGASGVDDSLDVVDLGPWDDDGFPAPERKGRWLPLLLSLAAALLVIGVVVVGFLGNDADTEIATAPDEATTTSSNTGGPMDDSTTSTTSTTEPGEASSTTVSVPVTQAVERTDTTSPDLAVPPPPADGAPDTTPKPVSNPPTTVTTTTTTVPAPTVTLTLSPADVTAGPGAMTTATVNVTAPTGGAETAISWGGPVPGSVTVSGTGTHHVDIGPFLGAPSVPFGTITVTATTTANGTAATGTDTATLTVHVVPG